MQLRQHILRGALYGLWAWLVYGIVEFVLTCGIPMLFEPGVELLRWQLRPLALVFGVYATVGLVLGGAGGALLAWAGRRRRGDGFELCQITAALGLALAFVANLLTGQHLTRPDYIAIVIAVLLAASFTLAIAWSPWLKRTAFLANPLAISLLLLALPWVLRVGLLGHSTALKTGVSLLLFAGIVVLAALWVRLRSRWGEAARRSQVVMAGAVFLLLSSGVMLSRRPSTIRVNQKTRSAQPIKPNVILITMDTVRADHLSQYGYERDTTPQLRDFAREATLYTHAIATSDQTLTTHASIFTGLYPGWHDAYLAPPEYPRGRPLSPQYVTLAEALRSEGYWTAGVVANYAYLQPSLGLARGFTTYEYASPARISSIHERFYLREGARRLLSLVVDTAGFDPATLRAADINRRASTLLNQARGGPPFFLFLNYMDAHMPYVPPPPFNDRFPGRDPHIQPRSEAGFAFTVISGQHHINEAEKRHFVSQYDGGIAYMDSEIGSLLARLRQLGLYEKTLIIIAADHGEAFGERDLMTHELGFVYQNQVRIPLLIKYPGQHEARQSDVLVSQVDLMPTVLDVAGISPPSGVQGETLRLPRVDSSDRVYSEAKAMPISFLPAAETHRLGGVRRAILAGRWKLITWTEGPSELYDLEVDPNETRNQYQAGDARAAALADQLSAWVAAVPQQIGQPRKLDKSSVERLRSLGYAQ